MWTLKDDASIRQAAGIAYLLDKSQEAYARNEERVRTLYVALHSDPLGRRKEGPYPQCEPGLVGAGLGGKHRRDAL
jgi:hypothetical protein